jgi:hypothetical protein
MTFQQFLRKLLSIYAHIQLFTFNVYIYDLITLNEEQRFQSYELFSALNLHYV